jgi:aspartate kinase
MSLKLTHDRDYETVVVKIGGSVLTGLRAYRRAARFLTGAVRTAPRERFVVVVSAQFGQTDRLERLARRISPDPDPAARDLLWSIGELRSVAVLTLCLHRRGISALGLNVHETGLGCETDQANAPGIRLNPLLIRHRLAQARIIVVPGFLATGAGQRILSLGRGGSDLTAVLLASALSAARCELVKDVPGYLAADPARDPTARPVTALTYNQALAMAAVGCDLVQVAALEAARSTRTPLLIRNLDPEANRTLVSGVSHGPDEGATPAALSA